MSDATLWINDADSTATITGVNVSYTMPLWVFEGIRDIIVTEVEKKAEVTYHDFDIQQELLDRYRADNVKLREQVALMYRDMQGVLDMSTDTVLVDDIGTLRDEMDCHMQVMAELRMPPVDYEQRMHELGVEVNA